MKIILIAVGAATVALAILAVLSWLFFNWLREIHMKHVNDNFCAFCKTRIGDTPNAVYKDNHWFCGHRHYGFWLSIQDNKERRRESDKRGEGM